MYPTEPIEPAGQPSGPGSAPPPAADYFQPDPPAIFNQPLGSEPPRRSRRKLFVIVSALALLIGGAGMAAYAGVYLPDSPDQLWSSAMVNTGRAYDELTAYAKSSSDIKGWSQSGSFDMKGAITADGTFEGRNDGKTGQYNAAISAGDTKVGVDVRSVPSATSLPDIYFKVDGIQGLAQVFGLSDPATAASLNAANSQWYVIDHSFFDQFADSSSVDLQYSLKDVNELLTAIGKSTKQYVFTDDAGTMVIRPKQNIGREKQDGRNVYHYKVAVNKSHLQTYVAALCKDVSATKFGKVLLGAAGSVAQCSDLQKTADGVKDGATADTWVDTRTKLVHKVRFTDSKNAADYLDISQDFQGGDEVPLKLAVHNADKAIISDGALDIVLDKSTSVVRLTGKYVSKTNGKVDQSADLEMTIKPQHARVNVEKPPAAKSLSELLGNLHLEALASPAGLQETLGGASPAAGSGSSGTQAGARDTERQADLQALKAQLEAYHVQHGYYPTLAHLNSVSWRAANLPGLDKESLKDPLAGDYLLADTPANKKYSYEVSDASGSPCAALESGCQSYTLTAMLENDGDIFTLNSLTDEQP